MNPLVDAWQVLQQGDRAGANQMVRQYLEQQPQVVAAWLLLAETASDPLERRAALAEALRLDPKNTQAQQAMAALAETYTRDFAPRQTHPAPNAPTVAMPAPRAVADMMAQLRRQLHIGLLALIALASVLLVLRWRQPAASPTFTPASPGEMRVAAFLTDWADLITLRAATDQDLRIKTLNLVAEHTPVGDRGIYIDALEAIDVASFRRELAQFGTPVIAWVEAELILEESSPDSALVRVERAVLVVEFADGQQLRTEQYLPAIERYPITQDPVYGWGFAKR